MVSNGAAMVLVAAKTATLVFGGALAYLSYKAYRRTGSRALWSLAVGIGLLISGAALGGTLHQFAGLGLETSVSVQSVFTAVGFAVMTYSLFAEVSSAERRAGRSTKVGD